MPNKIIGAFSLPTPEAELVSMYSLTKTDMAVADQTLLNSVGSPSNGDIAVIDTVISGENFGKGSYVYDEENTTWLALNGNVEADKCIMTSDIVMAGNYTAVGNLTKTQTGTATFATKGMSVAEAMTTIFSKRLQPTITANPSLGTVSINKSTKVEVGTNIGTVEVSAVTFNAGSYTYGPATQCAANGWTTTRVTNLQSTPLSLSGSNGATSDVANLVIGDQTGAVTSVKYTVACDYSAGAVANDNLGSASEPVVQIASGSLTKTSATITGFRKYFYGAKTTVGTVTSDFIRSLTNSTAAAVSNTSFSITIPEGCKQVIIAYPATLRDLTNVLDTGAFGTDIVGSFVKTTVDVEGASDYTAIPYKVFTYTPAAALGSNTFNVKI